MSTYRACRGPVATTLSSTRRPVGATALLSLVLSGAFTSLACPAFAQSNSDARRAEGEGDRDRDRDRDRTRDGEAGREGSGREREGERRQTATARPHLMSYGAMVTDVADALDEGAVWSFHLGASFVHSRRTALLQRELSAETAVSADELAQATALGITPYRGVARYSHVQSRLDVNAELAIYHDFSLFFGLPVILADDRSFRAEGDPNAANTRLRDGFTVNGNPSQLFALPTMGDFASPTRAGIDYLRVGLRGNLLNQNRDRHMPTWLLAFEWRPPVGSVLTPCFVPAGQVQPLCPENRPASYQFTFDPANPNNITNLDFGRGNPAGVSPGISRRVHGLYLQTVLSRRIGYIEPYGGLEAMVELPAGDLAQWRFGGNRPVGQVSSIPPIQGALMAGVEIYPWENRELWQRFGIDLRVRAEYRSPGREFTPLYDALGSSSSYPLSGPTWAINDVYRDNSYPPGPPEKAIFFSGTTTEQAHARVGGQIGLSFIATRWLRFSLGAALTYITPHLITATDACNPGERPSDFLFESNPANREQYRGGCIGDASPDPQHRAVIDLPGQRFRLVEDMVFDLWLNAMVTPRF